MNEPRTNYNRRKRWYDCLTAPMMKCAKWLLILIFLVLAVVIAFIAFYVWRASEFDMAEIPRTVASTQAVADEGQNLGPLYNRSGILVKYEQLPRTLVEALMAREDEGFQDHNGVDFGALVRSMLRNAKDGSYTQGGSTLTMQLARNVYELRAKSLDRKFLEIFLALRIENNYSKPQIMEAYLNRVYFGAGAYGIGDAAQTFFRKSVSELTLGEGAMLVGILRGPSLFNPFRNEKSALKQRDETLDRMVDADFITAEQALEAKKKPLDLAPNDMSFQASYPLQWIRREMDREVLKEQKNQAEGEAEERQETGLYLATSFNLALQRHVERATEMKLQEMERSKDWPLPKRSSDPANCIQAAVLVVRPNTGDLLALVGGRDSMDGKNIWTDLDRPVGELFAPVVYAAVSEAAQFIVRGNPYESSRNVSEGSILELAKKAGLSGDLPRGKNLAEGKFERRLIDLLPLLLSLHNGGYAPRLHSITTAATPKGVVLYESTHPRLSGTTPILPPDSARVVYRMPPFFHNEASRIVSLQTPMDDFKGVFTARIHPKIAVFVWVGQETPTPGAYDKASFRQFLNKSSSALAMDILGFVVPLPKVEEKPVEAAADKGASVKKAPPVPASKKKKTSSGRSGTKKARSHK